MLIPILEGGMEQIVDSLPAETTAAESVSQENMPSVASKPKVVKRVKKPSKKLHSPEGDEERDESGKKPTVRRKTIKKVQKSQQSRGDQI